MFSERIYNKLKQIQQKYFLKLIYEKQFSNQENENLQEKLKKRQD